MNLKKNGVLSVNAVRTKRVPDYLKIHLNPVNQYGNIFTDSSGYGNDFKLENFKLDGINDGWYMDHLLFSGNQTRLVSSKRYNFTQNYSVLIDYELLDETPTAGLLLIDTSRETGATYFHDLKWSDTQSSLKGKMMVDFGCGNTWPLDRTVNERVRLISTFEPVHRVCRVYVNGVLVFEEFGDELRDEFNRERIIYVGSDYLNGRNTNFKLYDFRVYDKTLTPEEVLFETDEINDNYPYECRDKVFIENGILYCRGVDEI